MRLWSEIKKSNLCSNCFYMTTALKFPHLGTLQISFGANMFFNMTVTQYWWWEAQLQVLYRGKIHLQGGQWPEEPQGSSWMSELVIRCILHRHPSNIKILCCSKTQRDSKLKSVMSALSWGSYFLSTQLHLVTVSPRGRRRHLITNEMLVLMTAQDVNIKGVLLGWVVTSASSFSFVS